MENPFTQHPANVGESYFEHLGMAASFGWRMIAGGLACMVHGIFPFAFEKTASCAVAKLHDRMVTNRDRRLSQSVNAANSISNNASMDFVI
ncbi:DUF6356 family protein [Erythrobacter sp. F6033]|uniref:DUF6356 family protein n=1 Tax=Erythrobacter sp. F6033 TaxID=2926401 RepID=UPI001FF5AD24|nr:DUF6356 family protein [Erythrobacter sp. F6033]MCK0127606.1 DUF6356 family protein [Erythrobacter sp. F6033]